MFRTRLLSGIVLVALALLLIITGGPVLLVSTAILSLIGMFEFYRALGFEKTPLAFSGYAVAILYFADLQFRFMPSDFMVMTLFLVLVLIIYVLSYPKYDTAKAMGAFFGLFYVAVMLSYIYLTRQLPHGEYVVWLIFLASWGSDTCAYCIGKLFGKHKMTPVLSPNKSVEGGIGGVAGAMLLTLIYLLVFQKTMHLHTTTIVLLTLSSGAGALISMVGDLAASAIKRNYGIKDYGKLIPGHGGVLDRFDSVIITAPVIFYFSSVILARLPGMGH